MPVSRWSCLADMSMHALPFPGVRAGATWMGCRSWWWACKKSRWAPAAWHAPRWQKQERVAAAPRRLPASRAAPGQTRSCSACRRAAALPVLPCATLCAPAVQPRLQQVCVFVPRDAGLMPLHARGRAARVVTSACRLFSQGPAAATRTQVVQEANPDWRRVGLRQLSGMLLLAHALPPLADHVQCVMSTAVPTGVGGFGGNKGAAALSLHLHRQRILLLNCHFAAHQVRQQLACLRSGLLDAPPSCGVNLSRGHSSLHCVLHSVKCACLAHASHSAQGRL